MKILNWNIQCAAGSRRYGRENLMSLFKEKPNYDIIKLNEFYRLQDYNEFEGQIKSWGYDTFITPAQEGNNGIFIAVSKEYKPKLNMNEFYTYNLPNMLIIAVEFENKEVQLIGVRLFGGYENKELQLRNLINIISKFDNVIVGGDFNNGRIYGKQEELYNMKQIRTLYKGKSHINYNYHTIKLTLNENNFEMITPTKGISFPYKNNPKTGSRIDHFAVKGLKMRDVEYIETELSDHNQLVGNLIV